MYIRKRSYLAILLAVLLIFSYSFPVAADDLVNSDSITQGNDTGNSVENTEQQTPEDEGSGSNNVVTDIGESESDAVNNNEMAPDDTVGDNQTDNDQPLSDETDEGGSIPDEESADSQISENTSATADEPSQPQAPIQDNSGASVPPAVSIPSDPITTTLQIRNEAVSVGQDVIIDVTSVLSERIAYAQMNRFVVELSRLHGLIASGDVSVYVGSEQIFLEDQGGVSKGYWTPSEPILLDSSNPQATCSFIFKFMQGGQYDLDIFADGVHYQVEEVTKEQIVSPPLPIPEIVNEEVLDQNEAEQGIADEAEQELDNGANQDINDDLLDDSEDNASEDNTGSGTVDEEDDSATKDEDAIQDGVIQQDQDTDEGADNTDSNSSEDVEQTQENSVESSDQGDSESNNEV